MSGLWISESKVIEVIPREEQGRNKGEESLISLIFILEIRICCRIVMGRKLNRMMGWVPKLRAEAYL